MTIKKKLIYGIQQIGVGTDNAYKTYEWYAATLGSKVIVFEDKNEATYMAPYMGGNSHKKRAILAMNPNGGSGYELWQYLDRTPQKPTTPILLGDYGINAALVKTHNIAKSQQFFKEKGVTFLSSINTDPDGNKSFYIEDPNGNCIKIKEFDSWYSQDSDKTGGPFGAIIGVSDMDKALSFYTDILEYDHVIYDKSGVFPDLFDLTDGISNYRRVLLTAYKNRRGGFSKLLGKSQIELIQCLDSEISRKPIFENRYWGDFGFIHLAFDVRNLDLLVTECQEKGFPFKILSDGSFNMGEAAGSWGYVEDPDGTLIEFVETHKVPIIKWLNININLKSRSAQQPLPDWMINAMLIKKNEITE